MFGHSLYSWQRLFIKWYCNTIDTYAFKVPNSLPTALKWFIHCVLYSTIALPLKVNIYVMNNCWSLEIWTGSTASTFFVVVVIDIFFIRRFINISHYVPLRVVSVRPVGPVRSLGHRGTRSAGRKIIKKSLSFYNGVYYTVKELLIWRVILVMIMLSVHEWDYSLTV